MSNMDSAALRHIKEQVDRLGSVDQLALATWVFRCLTMESTEAKKPTNLSEFYGTVQFPIDGVEYQRQIRDGSW